MQKPFNAEGLDLSFLFDCTYPDPSVKGAKNMAAAPDAMPGFTLEQTSSLRQMLSSSIGEALEPLLSPLHDLLNAWDRRPQSLSLNTSSTQSTFPNPSVETQSSTSGTSHNDLSITESVEPLVSESRTTKSVSQPNEIKTNLEADQTPSFERVPAKRKATAIDEAATPAAEKKCTFGPVKKETSPTVKSCRTEVQATEEQLTPETFGQNLQPSLVQDQTSLFLSPAPGQSDAQPSFSQGQVKEESPADTESAERQPYPVSTGAGGLRSSDANQPDTWLVSAKSSAELKILFKHEPRMDEPCPTRDYSAEKPASLVSPSSMYERTFPRLPFDAPRGCAHIVDVMRSSHNRTDPPIKMADIIATFLFNYCPDLLYVFLNVNRHPEFIFTRREASSSGHRDFSIERSSFAVTCTFHHSDYPEERKSVEEEHSDEETRIKQFGATSHDQMQFTCEMKPWGKWVTSSWRSGAISREAYSMENRRMIERYAHAFGAFIFRNRMWMEGEGVTFEGGATSA